MTSTSLDHTSATQSSETGRSLRIGLVAPPWAPVPPVAYGGIELMVDALARGLTDLGHEVRLFTVGESTCEVERGWLYDHAPDQIGTAIPELRHAAAAHEYLAACDIVHDHSLAGVLLASRDRGLHHPTVTTCHGPFTRDLVDLYHHTRHRVPIIAISADQAARAPRDLPVTAVIHHGLDLARYRPEPHPAGDRYLLVLARMHEHKGIDVAVAAARRARIPLVIAAKCREPGERDYYHRVIEPQLGGDVTFVGEVDHARKIDLLRGAIGLLNPIQWDEPFGLVMIEALACGTPVIATNRGAAPEIVTPGVNGYLANTTHDLATAIHQLPAIDRRRCRHDAELRFSMAAMATEHTAVYQHTLTHHPDQTTTLRLAKTSSALT
jgi:glycosyltransferase involved in cell wall biosynthesis